eukprot:scaffold1328_cov162-Amphora_coffeaeformis.AAC.14
MKSVLNHVKLDLEGRHHSGIDDLTKRCANKWGSKIWRARQRGETRQDVVRVVAIGRNCENSSKRPEEDPRSVEPQQLETPARGSKKRGTACIT